MPYMHSYSLLFLLSSSPLLSSPLLSSPPPLPFHLLHLLPSTPFTFRPFFPALLSLHFHSTCLLFLSSSFPFLRGVGVAVLPVLQWLSSAYVFIDVTIVFTRLVNSSL